VTELQAQISALLAQIAALQAQLGQSTGGTVTSPTTVSGKFCYTFIRNLKLGDGSNSFSEPMVSALQTALRKEGFTISDSEGPKGGSIFGESTAAAVVAFQQKYANEILASNGLTQGNGFVGVSTRAKLNELYGCNGPTVPTTTSSIPSIHIAGSSGSKSSDTSLSVNVGDTITISGIPQNLQGMTYYYGSGYPTSGYFNMAYFFDQNFGNNNLCGNNAATVNGPWTMTCTAKVAGSSVFYIVIYANGQTYQSNVVTVSVGQTPVATPTVSLSINSSFGSGSNTATMGSYKVLNWSSTNASTCTASGIPGSWNGSRATSGSESIGPINQTAAYTITCYGSGLSQSATVTIYVGNSIPPVTPTINYFNVSPSTITAGQSSTLSYSASNATGCGIDQGVDTYTKTSRTDITVTPTNTTVYTLTCYNEAPGYTEKGAPTVQKSVTVNVTPKTTSTTPAPTAYLNNASDQKNSVTVTSGSPVNFIWGATNFTKCQMFKDGTLFNDGVYNSYGVNIPSYSGTFYVPNQTQSATYTLTCTGSGGSQSGSVAVSISGQSTGGTATSPTPSTSVDDPYSANYSKTSSIPLSSTEKTVGYTYSSNPCGGLMTDYINPGSVYVGNGPVYASASTACSPATPNTTTFRVYSCRNNASLQGQAVFAFQCNAVTSSLNIAQPNYASVYESLRGLLQQISNQIGN